MSKRSTVAIRLLIAVRGGSVIILSAGQDAFEQLLRAHWRRISPQPFAATEALAFTTFLASDEARKTVDHLGDLFAFEVEVTGGDVDDLAERASNAIDGLGLVWVGH